MARGFDFDAFDLKIAVALGEVPATIDPVDFTPLRIVRNEDISPEEQNRFKRMQGIKSLGETAIPHGLKPAS